MVVKKRGLGRGLDALLSSVSEANDTIEQAQQPITIDENGEGYFQLDVDKIQRGKYQPRRDLEPHALEELSSSIRTHGVMQPIVVRLVKDDHYEIIAGERRWRAAQMAELTTIPVIIKNVSDESAIAMALIENIQRENLNPMEEALALSRLQHEFELTQLEVAEAVGKSRSAVANLLRLMNLNDEVKKMLEYGDLEMGHARALLALDDALQPETAVEIVSNSLNVRQTEELVKKIQNKGTPPLKPAKAVAKKDTQLESLANDLSKKLATKVSIDGKSNGKGKITIVYDSSESLDAIIKNFH